MHFLAASLSMSNGPFHAPCSGCQDKLSPKISKQLTPLYAHCFRHGEDQSVATGSTDKGQPDPGVSRGRLNNSGLRGKQAVRLCGIQHGHGNSIFYTAQRVGGFQLCHDLCCTACPDPTQTNQRGITHALCQICTNPHLPSLAFFVPPQRTGMGVIH